MSKPTLKDIISSTIIAHELDLELGADMPVRVENRLNKSQIQAITDNVREYFRRQLIPDD